MDKNLRFKTQLMKTGANTTGIVVPADVLAALDGGKRPAVVVQINDYTYRTTVGIMSGQAMLPFSAQHREKSGIRGGDPIEVTLTPDSQPRTIDVPPDLATALTGTPGLQEAFHRLAPSRQKADVDNVMAAKSDETRKRRIASIILRLGGTAG